MGQPLGKVLNEQTRGEFIIVIHGSEARLSPGSYLTVKFSQGDDRGDLLCQIEGPFSTGHPSEQIPGARTLSCRVVTELHPAASGLWSLGVAGGDIFEPSTDLLTQLFSGNFYSSVKKKDVTNEIPLIVGELRNYDRPVQVSLLGEEMNSHTCVLAQSGAGKSYAVGVLLEELAFKTAADIVIFDSNSDFVRFNELLPLVDVNTPKNICAKMSEDNYDKFAQIHSALLNTGELRILSRRGLASPENTIAIPFFDLARDDRIRVLGIDEIQQFSQLIALGMAIEMCLETIGESFTIGQLVQKTFDILHHNIRSGTLEGGIQERWVNTYFGGDVYQLLPHLTHAHARLQRANAHLFWKESETEIAFSAIIKEEKRKVMVLDLAAFAPGIERATVAAHALESLWSFHETEKRAGRERVCFIIIDEAHHLAPAGPFEEWQERTVDVINRIAGEGRKYGLFLIFISQRPSKIHENTFTQADNYLIMKMQNEEDLAAIRRTVRGISHRVIDLLPEFRLGEALVAGKYTPAPVLIRFGRRRTREGGRTPAIPKGPITPSMMT